MTLGPTDEEVKAFNRLVFKAYMLHTFTWCIKRQKAIFTASLRGEECLRCEHDLLQGGICDPL